MQTKLPFARSPFSRLDPTPWNAWSANQPRGANRGKRLRGFVSPGT
ncbi:hypothetical protein [Martelella soudanensis]|nr:MULTISPECIES: hypothetical protein [unclassified Martelella]